MRHILFTVLSIVMCAFTATEAQPSEKEQMEALVEGSAQFSFDMYRQLKAEKGNLFFSPYSISSAFAMAAAGARNETEQEMLKTLHYRQDFFPAIARLNGLLIFEPTKKAGSPILQIANALWPQKGLELLPPFVSSIEKDFGSTIKSVDYVNDAPKAIEIINRWASEHTNGKINNLLSTKDVSADTKLVITSAVYMKAAWLNQFDEKNTRKSFFHFEKDQAIEVPMMQKTDRYPLFVDEDVAVLELPYKHEAQGPALSMMVVLPKDVDGLSKLEAGLSLQQWNKWVTQTRRQRVHVELPKFKIENKLVLNKFMEALGMRQAFTRKADFSGIAGLPNIYINEAIHQTFIDVDENGTEAAAVTALGMRTTSIEIPEEPYDFIADHPFFFIIMDQRTHAILFMGRYVKL